MTVYGQRINVHPDRYGATKSARNRLLVVHTSEGGEGLASAESLGAFMTLPGDRIDPTDGSRFGASYQYVTDTDRVLPATPDNVVAYAAAGGNNDGIHVCIPGRAAQTRAQWLDSVSRAYIRQAAAVLVDKAMEHSIPLERLTVAQIVAGQDGYCGHVDVSNAYHRSDHTDPGAQFPWDVLAADIAALTTPEAPTMATLASSVRILDTRLNGGSRVAPGSSLRVGVLTPPAWAGAAIVDIGIAEPNGPGFITAWSGVGDRPNTSVQDFEAWSTRSNLWHVPLSKGADGGWGFSVYALVATHLIIDLVGWDSVV